MPATSAGMTVAGKRALCTLATVAVALFVSVADVAAQPTESNQYRVGLEAQLRSLQCNGAQKPWMVAELLFGRSNVSEAAWDRFLATELTPRFPDGLTVYDARGQWRNPKTQTISRERTKVVMIAMPPAADTDARLQAIIEAYKSRFRQQSVGLILRPSCVSF